MEVPKEEPPSAERYETVRNIGDVLDDALAAGLSHWVRNTLVGLASILWLRNKTTRYYYQLRAKLDPPKTLEELQNGVAHPTFGYEIHHIVEFNKADKDNFPESWFESSENFVEFHK